MNTQFGSYIPLICNPVTTIDMSACSPLHLLLEPARSTYPETTFPLRTWAGMLAALSGDTRGHSTRKTLQRDAGPRGGARSALSMRRREEVGVFTRCVGGLWKG